MTPRRSWLFAGKQVGEGTRGAERKGGKERGYGRGNMEVEVQVVVGPAGSLGPDFFPLSTVGM